MIEAINAQNQGDVNQWRLRKALSGGGSLPDVGIYCLNAARAVTGEEPVEIEAQLYSTPNDPRFREVEESVTWLMRFPSGVMANLSTSYGIHRASRLAVNLDGGSLVLENAFPYKGQRLLQVRAQEKFETKSVIQVGAEGSFCQRDGSDGRLRAERRDTAYAGRGGPPRHEVDGSHLSCRGGESDGKSLTTA